MACAASLVRISPSSSSSGSVGRLRAGAVGAQCSSDATRAGPDPSSRRRSPGGSLPAARTSPSAASCLTPAVALLAASHGAVVSASHNPPEYNGVKFFAAGGRKLEDDEEAAIEGLLDGAAADGGEIDDVGGLAGRYVDVVTDRFGSELTGLRIVLDCANGAMSGVAPVAFERLGAQVTAIGERARRDEHQRRLRRDRPLAPPACRSRGRARPRRRLRRRRRPHARRGRRRERGRRRPDRRRSWRSTSASTSSPSRR